MRPAASGLGVGLVFGVVLSWSGMTSPEVIRAALLFEDSYLFLFFGSAVAVGALGLAVLRRTGARAVLTGGPIGWAREQPARRHIVGSLVFGIGWGGVGRLPRTRGHTGRAGNRVGTVHARRNSAGRVPLPAPQRGDGARHGRAGGQGSRAARLAVCTHQHKPPVGQPVDLPHGRALERRELRGQEGTRLARALRPAGSGAG